MIDTGIAPADLSAPNHHSCGRCSSRAFAIFADVARTAVRAATAELSESRLVRAKLVEHAKTREDTRRPAQLIDYRHRIGGPGRADRQAAHLRCSRHRTKRPHSQSTSITDAARKPKRRDVTVDNPELLAALISKGPALVDRVGEARNVGEHFGYADAVPFRIFELELYLTSGHHFRTAYQRRTSTSMIEERSQFTTVEPQVEIPIVGGRGACDCGARATEHQFSVVATENAEFERGIVGSRLEREAEDLAVPRHAASDIGDAQNGDNGSESDHAE